MICKGIELNGNTFFQNLKIATNNKLTLVSGQNGSGKTTLLKILSKKSYTRHYFEGADCFNFINSSKATTLDFEVIIEGFKVKQSLSTYSRIFNSIQPVENQYGFKQLGLLEYIDYPMSKLSLGTKKKLLIFLALSTKRNIILLDEPFENLDEASCNILMELISEKVKEGKQFFITVHHSIENLIGNTIYDKILL